MNRREFIFNAAMGLFVAASPKIIFDVGRFAAKRKPDPVETITITTRPNGAIYSVGGLVKLEYADLSTKYFWMTKIHSEPSRIIIEADRCFET